MKNNNPPLRFPQFTDEWKLNKLGKLLSFKNGINASKEQYGKGVKFVNVLDILNNNFITYDKIVGSVDIDDSTLEKNSVEYGDILFQRSSETREEAGTANVYLDHDRKAAFGGFIIRGKKMGEYDPIFMNNLLKTSRARKEITTRAGGSTRYNVGQDTLSEVELKFPSIGEQVKIGSLFTLFEQKIENQKDKIEHLVKLKRGMIQKIFSQELQFKDNNGDDFPDWASYKLGEIGVFKSGTGFPDRFQGHNTLEFPFFKVSDMNHKLNSKTMIHANNTVSRELIKEMKANIIDKPSIIFAKVGAAIFLERKRIVKTPFLIDNNMMAFIPSKDIKLEFCFHLLNSIRLSRFAQVGALPSYNSSDLSTIPLLVPVLKEQEKITNYFSLLDLKIEKEKEKLRILNEIKSGLMQQMFM